MSEVDLTALAQSGKDREESKSPTLTPMQEVNAVLKECGFGIFHVRLLMTAFIGFVTGVIVSTTTSYLLPSAECDLHMDLVQKGLLNATPYLGMLFSSVIAGFLTDTFGRKLFILTGFSGIFLVTIVSATSQSYNVLVTAKFFEGVLFASSFSAAVTLTSEFCHQGIRDRVLIFQSSFISLAHIIIGGLSWAILVNDWHLSLFGGKLVLNTWNFYLYIMSLWALTATILYIFIPESPKYLVTQNRFDEARAILIKIYKTNKRRPVEEFQYKDIWKDSKATIPEEEGKVKYSLAHHLVVGLRNTKPMFKRPLVIYLVLICTMNFFTMALYNVFRLWYPQVSTIVEHNSFITPEGVGQDLCGMLDNYTSQLKVNNVSTTDVCVPIKSGSETYITSMIIGSICIIPYFISGVLVNKVGKKPLLIVATLICLAATISLRFANSKVAVVSLFAVVLAIAQMLMSLNQATVIQFFPTTTSVVLVNKVGKKPLLIVATSICLAATISLRFANSKVAVVSLFAVVLAFAQMLMSLNQATVIQFFPTTTRTLAISMMMMTGRIGTLIGNVAFPILLKLGCVIPFFTLAGMMLCVFVMSLFLPSKRK